MLHNYSTDDYEKHRLNVEINLENLLYILLNNLFMRNLHNEDFVDFVDEGLYGCLRVRLRRLDLSLFRVICFYPFNVIYRLIFGLRLC